MLMDSLNELGYQGPITAIAPANVQQKLALLLSDELNARVTWQTQTFDPDRPASDPRASGQPGTQGLVMVAASDRLDGDEEVAERFLNFLGVDRAIVLKPYAWGTSHRYLYSRPSPDSGVVVTDLEGSESPGNTIAPDALFNFHTPLLTHDELNDLIDRRVTASDVAAWAQGDRPGRARERHRGHAGLRPPQRHRVGPGVGAQHPGRRDQPLRDRQAVRDPLVRPHHGRLRARAHECAAEPDRYHRP